MLYEVITAMVGVTISLMDDKSFAMWQRLGTSTFRFVTGGSGSRRSCAGWLRIRCSFGVDDRQSAGFNHPLNGIGNGQALFHTDPVGGAGCAIGLAAGGPQCMDNQFYAFNNELQEDEHFFSSENRNEFFKAFAGEKFQHSYNFV